MDTELIKRRRKELQDKINRNTSIWKPSSGKSKVRILPYKYNLDNPFIEVWWHWNIGGNSILCLKNNFGEECPVCEFARKLWSSDAKEDKEIAKKLFANLRFYAPVAVRGQEYDGAKFWGFGQQIYDDLTAVLEDEGCGDFTDIEKGRDVEVTVKTPEETGKKFITVSAKLSFNNSPLSNDENILKKLLDEQKNIFELFPKPTKETVTELMEKWLQGNAGEEETEIEVEESHVPEQPIKESVINKFNGSSTGSSSTADDIAERFKALFNEAKKSA